MLVYQNETYFYFGQKRLMHSKQVFTGSKKIQSKNKMHVHMHSYVFISNKEMHSNLHLSIKMKKLKIQKSICIQFT